MFEDAEPAAHSGLSAPFSTFVPLDCARRRSNAVVRGEAPARPVLAVYGNTDPTIDPRLSATIERTVGGVSIHVSHGHELGSPTPAKLLERYAADVIVYGHTHQQLVARAGGRLVVNPGAAGARRFKLEPSVARLTIADGIDWNGSPTFSKTSLTPASNSTTPS